MDRTDYRERLSTSLYARQLDNVARRVTGSAAAEDTFDIIERQLRLGGIDLDDAERSTLLWLCGGEISTTATIVALILDRPTVQA